MLGYAASPFALARHLLDYPLTDGPFNIDELPLPTGSTTTSTTPPPPRPPRPDASLECVSPVPVRAYNPTWISPYESSGEEDIEMTSSSPKEGSPSPQRQEVPSTPRSSQRSTRGAPVHKHSPVTPSRLSLPPITALNTDDFTPESVMDSPYRPLYVVPRRKTPELIELANKKSMEFSKYNGPKPPKPRRRTLSEQRESFSNCRIADVDAEVNSLADTVRRLIHKFPEVSQSVPSTGASSQAVAAAKTKQRSFSFSALAQKYTQPSLDPNHHLPQSPSLSPPPRQSSSRRYGPFSSSPNSSPLWSPSSSAHALGHNSSPSPNRTPRQREPTNTMGTSPDSLPPSQTWSSSPTQRDSPNDRAGSTTSPTTPKALGRTAFYGHPNSPLRHDNSSVRPLSISLPPPPTYESMMAGFTGAYPPTPRGTRPGASGLTSPIGALWEPYTKTDDKKAVPWATEGSYDHSSTEVVVITSPPDFSRQYKRAADPKLDTEFQTQDITMGCWNEEDAEGEIDYELETSPLTPKAKGKKTLDYIAEGAWLAGQAVDEADEDPVDKFGFPIKNRSNRSNFYGQDDEPPFEMPPTPRLANATLPSSDVVRGQLNQMQHMIGNAITGNDMVNKTYSDDMPAFLTPFVQRKTHPYNRSADYVLAQTRKREAGIVRAPPGTVRPRKKRAQREITNLCIFTLQRNFTKALQDAEISPKLQPKLIAPPGLDPNPPTENPWWGERLSPPKQHQQLAESSDEENDTDFSEDDEDDEMDDRGMWAPQSYGINLGLGLGMGFDFKFPSSPRPSAASLPVAERSIDRHSPSPPLVRTPSDKGVSRSKKTVEFDALSPALDLKDCSNDGGLTPSPVSPEVVTPEFEEESGKRTILVKENYKERPIRSGSMFNSVWNRRLPSNDVDDDSDSDDDRPLWPRPTKKDKGKGRAVPDIEEETPSSTTTNDESPIFIPSDIPIDPSLSDEVNYIALAEAFGVNADELAMQYMLEMSKLDNGKAAEVIQCGDSPGASGSGLPPCHSWAEDEDEAGDVEMSGGQSRSSTPSSPADEGTSSSSGQSSTPTNSFPAAFKSWYNQFTDRDEPLHSTPDPLRTRPGYGDEFLNEITDLLAPLHIEDTSHYFYDTDDDFDDAAPILRIRDDDGHNDYDDDSGNDDDNDTSDDDDETHDDDDDSGNDVDYTTLRDDEDGETKGSEAINDQRHHISNDLTIMTRGFLPELTLTPPSPGVIGAVSRPLRFGHKDDFINYRTRSPFLRVPDFPKATSLKESPTFFRLLPAYHQTGKSGEEFAKIMSTKWTSLKRRRRAVHVAPTGGGSNQTEYIRPTRLRRIVGDD